MSVVCVLSPSRGSTAVDDSYSTGQDKCVCVCVCVRVCVHACVCAHVKLNTKDRTLYGRTYPSTFSCDVIGSFKPSTRQVKGLLQH